MSRPALAAVIAFLLLLTPIGTVSAGAQADERGTTLVCVGAGGDGLSLLEWTPEEVAEYEARTGRAVAGLAPHPETGGCLDVAGLMVGWAPGTSWLCVEDAEGRWFGPGWVWSVYQSGDEIPPDPATGRCPQPGSPFQSASTELERAAATAVHLTELEVAGDYERLYAWMHPDAQAVVPLPAMVDWYRDVFGDRPPVWMTVDDVRLGEWTWEVTGKTYPSAAEVAFRQRFADGEETEGGVHLVRDQGVWRWFFGPDRAFIDQLSTAGPNLETLLPTLSDVPQGMAQLVEGEHALRELTATYTNPTEAESLYRSWGWEGNAYRIFAAEAVALAADPNQHDNATYVEVSLSRFASADDALAARDYTYAMRVAATGLYAAHPTVPDDGERVMLGAIRDEFDVTAYAIEGPILIRVTALNLHAPPGAVAGALMRLMRDRIAHALP